MIICCSSNNTFPYWIWTATTTATRSFCSNVIQEAKSRFPFNMMSVMDEGECHSTFSWGFPQLVNSFGLGRSFPARNPFLYLFAIHPNSFTWQ